MDGHVAPRQLQLLEPKRIGDIHPGGNPRFKFISVIGKHLRTEFPNSSHGTLTKLLLSPDLRDEMLQLAEQFVPRMLVTRPPEPFTKSKRRDANLAAMRQVDEDGELDHEAVQTLYGFSGWGGLSLEEVADQIPDHWAQHSESLLHEWYTPRRISDAIAQALVPHLRKLANQLGFISALEPSAGIGRFIDSFDRAVPDVSIRWTACELNPLSATILHKLHPHTRVSIGPYEEYNGLYGDRTYDLVVANPPFGSSARIRRYASLDPDPRFNENYDYAYFIKRSIAALKRCGIAVFVLPRRFMTGVSAESSRLRSYVFRRAHLLDAFRLPAADEHGTRTFPAMEVVVDVVVVQSRGGVLTADAPDDKRLIRGDWYLQHPHKILGEETDTGRYGYSVVGNFRGIPAIDKRPECATCTIEPEKAPRVRKAPSEIPPELEFAVGLGKQVKEFLAAVARGDASTNISWAELRTGLDDLVKAKANPWRWKDLRSLYDEGNEHAEALLRAFTPTGELVEELQNEPVVKSRDLDPEDIEELAKSLAPTGGGVDTYDLFRLHKQLGGTRPREKLIDHLLKRNWYVDRNDAVYPEWDYFSGNLWERLDSLVADEQGERQRKLLLEKIDPVVFSDIEPDPRHGWVPIEVISAWLDNLGGRSMELVREAGFVSLQSGTPTFEITNIVWWLNHLPFDPIDEPDLPKEQIPEAVQEEIKRLEGEGKDPTISVRRRLYDIYWLRSFRNWAANDEVAREQITDSYNRTFRGHLPAAHTGETLHIKRWNPDIKLRPHQVEAVQARLATRGGVLALAVGAGKTFTSLAYIAKGREEGWIKRPVVVIPAGIIWQWYDEVARVLPDYRVGVVGSVRYKSSRGKNKGKLVSRTADPSERTRIWLGFQSGFYDLVLLTDTSLHLTRVTPQELESYANRRSGMKRSMRVGKMKAEKKSKSNLTERDKAMIANSSLTWVQEKLEGSKKVRRKDPGVAWADLGIDCLVYDETGNIRKTWSAEPGPFGLPKYMGSSHEGSQRAWQADFRAALVRENGGTILGLSGTVGENSPVEPYNLLHFIDPSIMERRGIFDCQQFISRYIVIESKHVVAATGERRIADAVTGFRHLRELRNILYTHGSFVSHEEANIKLPESTELLVEVEMGDIQQKIYDGHRAIAAKALENKKRNTVFAALSRMKEVTVHESLGQGYSYKTAFGGLATKDISENALPVYLKEGWETKRARLQRARDSAKDDVERTEIDSQLAKLEKSKDATGKIKVVRDLPPPRTYHSPKFDECAQRVAENLTCGHVIFVESTAAHRWLTEVLVEAGVERERIAVFNGQVGEVTSITRAFNGSEEEERTLDVVITNKKGARGVNLQREACMLHNLDLLWTPADMEQRRGRIDRYGNTMPNIFIVFYFAKGSFDGFMFDLLAGKGRWRDSLFLRDGDRSINPAAQLDLGDQELFMLTARTPEEAQAFRQRMIDKEDAKRIAQARRRGANLFAKAAEKLSLAARSEDQAAAEKYKADALEMIKILENMDSRAWPWREATADLKSGDPLRHWHVDEAGKRIPVYAGMVVEDTSDTYQVGAIMPEAFGLRRNGAADWQDVADYVFDKRGFKYSHKDPVDDFSEVEVQRSFLTWGFAHPAWVARQWPLWASTIWRGVTKTRLWLPSFTRQGLAIVSAALLKERDFKSIIPPTDEGFRLFRQWAPVSRNYDDQLERVSQDWFRRELHLGGLPMIKKDSRRVFRYADTKCSKRILDMEPPAFMHTLQSEYERLAEQGHPQGVQAIRVAPGHTMEFKLTDEYDSVQSLARVLLTTLYRAFLGRWERLARAQYNHLNGVILNGLDEYYRAIDDYYERLVKVLGRANARTIQNCAQLASVVPNSTYKVSNDAFAVGVKESIPADVTHLRVAEMTRFFVPVTGTQKVSLIEYDLERGSAGGYFAVEVRSAERSTGNLFPIDNEDRLNRTVPLAKGTFYVFTIHDEQAPDATYSWVDVHPLDAPKVLTNPLDTLEVWDEV